MKPRISPRLSPGWSRVCHALDHLTQLHDDLRRVPPAVDGWEPPTGFDAGAQALSAWLNVSKDPSATPAPPVFDALEAASKQLTGERAVNRVTMLENIALQRMPTSTARNALDALSWADGALHHCWRMIEALRIASGDHPWRAVVTSARRPLKPISIRPLDKWVARPFVRAARIAL